MTKQLLLTLLQHRQFLISLWIRKISGGFTNIVNYKWFDLALTLTYSLGGYSFDKTGTYNETDGAKEQNYNLPIYELDRWQKPGDVTDVPRFVLGQAAGPQNSSRYVHSTDHLRVKNLTLGFTLPDQWLTKLVSVKQDCISQAVTC